MSTFSENRYRYLSLIEKIPTFSNYTMEQFNECENDLSAKTWTRAVDSINKAGFKDGAADGQTATFQSSFDLGYEQGFNFGLGLGLKQAVLSADPVGCRSSVHCMSDPRKINCQICTDTTLVQQSVAKLFSIQQEKNDETK